MASPRCKYCGEKIRWAKVPPDDRPLPFDLHGGGVHACVPLDSNGAVKQGSWFSFFSPRSPVYTMAMYKRDKVVAPGVWLIIIGLWSLVVCSLLLTGNQGSERDREFMDLAFPVCGVFWGAAVLAAGISMFYLRWYAVALTGSIIAILPASPCCIFGVPVGIWALIVLNREDVKILFSRYVPLKEIAGPAIAAGPDKAWPEFNQVLERQQLPAEECGGGMSMSLKIVPESLNGYCEKPSERISGQVLTDLHLLVVVSNKGPKAIKLGAESVTLTAFNAAGQLLIVEHAGEVNGQWPNIGKVTLLPNSEKPLKITFRILAKVLQTAKNIEKICLDIEYDSITVTKNRVRLFENADD